MKKLLLSIGILTTISLNAQMVLHQSLPSDQQTEKIISFINANENNNHSYNLKKAKDIGTPICESYADSYSIDDIPSFNRTNWIESSNLLWGRYYKQYYEFNDEVTGYLFQGGISRKYFISNDKGDTVYFASWKTAVRGLYLYKRFGCFTKYGRD